MEVFKSFPLSYDTGELWTKISISRGAIRTCCCAALRTTMFYPHLFVKSNQSTLHKQEEWDLLHKAHTNELSSMTWKPFLTFLLRKCKEFQPSTEGVDRRARRSHLYRGGGHKTLLTVSVLAPGAPVLPIKLWGSYGCNEVVGTKVAITAQLNCHQGLMEAFDQDLTENKVFTNTLRSLNTLDLQCGWQLF